MARKSREDEWKETLAKVKAKEKEKETEINETEEPKTIKKIVQPIDAWDDINNLNDGDDFKPEEEEITPMTEEEKKEIRKKLFVLLAIITVFLIGFLFILIFQPFDLTGLGEEKPDNEITEEEKKIDEENKKKAEEEKKQNNDLKKSLLDIKDGIVLKEHPEIQTIYKSIEYKGEENQEYNTFVLFSKDEVKISELTDKEKLSLAFKSKEITAKLEGANACKNTISKAEIDAVLKNNFNTSVTKYEDTTAVVYEGNKLKTYINAKYNKDKYELSCSTKTLNLQKMVGQELVTGAKEKDTIKLYVKVVFINKTGVYKDKDFTSIITNNYDDNTYMSKADTYVYEYKVINNSYYLNRVYKSK